MKKQKIKIGGAGIAGLTAAINLAKAGFEVIVYEKNKEVGGGNHGDFQGIENWSTEKNALEVLKGFNIDLTTELSCQSLLFKPWYGVTFFDCHSQKYEFTSNDPFFYFIKRGPHENCFDQFLKRESEKLGVKIELGRRVEKKDVDIVAFGHIGRAFALAVGITFKTDLEDLIITILDDNLSPKFYSYLIVINGEATLATCLSENQHQFKIYFENTLARFRKLLKFEIKDSKNFACVLNVGILPTQDKIYIGEAAGLQDALWGFGMRYAMLSGYLASRAIIENKDYWREIKQKIHPLLKTGIVNRFIWERQGNSGYIKTIRMMQSIQDDWKKTYYYNYQPGISKKILFPLSKFILRKKLI